MDQTFRIRKLDQIPQPHPIQLHLQKHPDSLFLGNHFLTFELNLPFNDVNSIVFPLDKSSDADNSQPNSQSLESLVFLNFDDFCSQNHISLDKIHQAEKLPPKIENISTIQSNTLSWIASWFGTIHPQNAMIMFDTHNTQCSTQYIRSTMLSSPNFIQSNSSNNENDQPQSNPPNNPADHLRSDTIDPFLSDSLNLSFGRNCSNNSDDVLSQFQGIVEEERPSQINPQRLNANFPQFGPKNDNIKQKIVQMHSIAKFDLNNIFCALTAKIQQYTLRLYQLQWMGAKIHVLLHKIHQESGKYTIQTNLQKKRNQNAAANTQKLSKSEEKLFKILQSGLQFSYNILTIPSWVKHGIALTMVRNTSYPRTTSQIPPKQHDLQKLPRYYDCLLAYIDGFSDIDQQTSVYNNEMNQLVEKSSHLKKRPRNFNDDEVSPLLDTTITPLVVKKRHDMLTMKTANNAQNDVQLMHPPTLSFTAYINPFILPITAQSYFCNFDGVEMNPAFLKQDPLTIMSIQYRNMMNSIYSKLDHSSPHQVTSSEIGIKHNLSDFYTMNDLFEYNNHLTTLFYTKPKRLSSEYDHRLQNKSKKLTGNIFTDFLCSSNSQDPHKAHLQQDPQTLQRNLLLQSTLYYQLPYTKPGYENSPDFHLQVKALNYDPISNQFEFHINNLKKNQKSSQIKSRTSNNDILIIKNMLKKSKDLYADLELIGLQDTNEFNLSFIT